MKGNEALTSLLALLERLGVPHMITGSYATNVYGLPRSTKDADVIVQKLRWVARNRREKDFADACNMMMVQAGKLDRPYIEHWCAELGAADQLAEARAIAEE